MTMIIDQSFMTSLEVKCQFSKLLLYHNCLERTNEANAVGENSSFIVTVCVKSVPIYHFKLAYVVLHMAVKEVFETNL